MAYQIANACYSTPQQAAQAAASAQLGSVIQNAGSSYIVEVLSVSDNSISYSFRPVAGGTPLTVVSAFNPQPCNLLQWGDGLQMGWMVAAAWVGAFSVTFLAKTLWRMMGDYGDS